MKLPADCQVNFAYLAFPPTHCYIEVILSVLSRHLPQVAITMGDYNGIGPEIVLKAVRSRRVRSICRPLLVGSLEVFEYYARRLGIRILLKECQNPAERMPPGATGVVEVDKYRRPIVRPGRLSADAGRFAGRSIRTAARLCMLHNSDAMVTGPVSKEAMALGGFRYPGQTEMLARLCGAERVAMMLVAGRFRVGLATVHMPLKRVPAAITRGLLLEKISTVHASLRKDFAIASPGIAVLGLNPHAGENGLLGKEERDRIAPAIDQARRRGWRVEGPFAADGFFGSGSYRGFDAVLALYHDQGLIPLKMEGFRTGVNVSCGLPIVRTSPDHGTAFDLAASGRADPTSMKRAIALAVDLAHNRRRRR